jgi:hypothetical protein
MSDALSRWTAFLLQVQSRHRDVLHEAETAARQFIESVVAGGDVGPLSNQLMATSARLQDLETRISDTWHAQAEQALVDAGHSAADVERERRVGRSLQWSLEDQREELDPRLFAHLARQRYAHARATCALTCPRCGAPYAGPAVFVAIDHVCHACHGTSLLEPGELMQSVAAIGAHALAQEVAIAEWRETRAAERRAHGVRPPRPLAVVVAIERAYIAYWRVYLAARAQLEPVLARDPAMEIRCRMEHWYVACAEYEPAWVEAGRPRLV